MDQGPENLSRDLILSFCQDFISRYQNPWPPDEQTLAREFVSYFHSFWFVTLSELERFCLAAGIELTQKSLFYDLLAVNCSLDGKRIIELDDRAQNLLIQPHTVLHEIRELLEYTFRDLGSPIANSAQIEMRANEFASLVMVSRFATEFAEWTVNAFEIQSSLLKFGAFVLIGMGVLAVSAHAYLGAVYPHLPGQQTEGQARQRYLT